MRTVDQHAAAAIACALALAQRDLSVSGALTAQTQRTRSQTLKIDRPGAVEPTRMPRSIDASESRGRGDRLKG